MDNLQQQLQDLKKSEDSFKSKLAQANKDMADFRNENQKQEEQWVNTVSFVLLD